MVFTAQAREDVEYWKRNNKAIFGKLAKLTKAIAINPFQGIGKPEPLKHELSGKWSRRINAEHRMAYEVSGDLVVVHQCRYHYLALFFLENPS